MNRCELIENEVKTLYRVSQVVNRSLALQESLHGVLEVLHENAGMQHGLVTLRDSDSGEQWIRAMHDGDPEKIERVRYRSGEGIIGTILERGRTVVVECIADEPRFLGRLGIYEAELPFVGVPIRVGEEMVGVLAAQPANRDVDLLSVRANFLEMVANLAEQFGREKYFFVEESLHYAYNDCEDRSVMFSWLVHELLGIRTVGLLYPGHMTTAVALRKARAEFATVDYQGSRYVIADPTYIGASVGMAMPSYAKLRPGRVVEIRH